MSFDLTKIVLDKTKSIIQEPQLVLEIDGLTTVLGSAAVLKYIRIGDPDLYIGDFVGWDDWVIGGFNEVEDQSDLLSLSGTTTRVQQQLLQDKGGVSSASSVQISLRDKDNFITRLITPGELVDDILGRKATLYLGYQNTAWPQDFIVMFTGVIDEITAGAEIFLSISHPENKKRSKIFQQRQTKLTAIADFRSEAIQSIRYSTKRDVSGTVTVEYLNTGTAGSEIVTVVGNAISVSMQSGVSTASNIRNAVEKTPTATALVSTQIISGQSATVQTATAAISLLSDTTLTVESTAGFLTPADGGTLRTYVRINDEIIEYTGLTATTFTGCTREAFVSLDLRTQGAQHQVDDEVYSFYRLQGSAFELALKLLIGAGPTVAVSNVNIETFVEIESVGTVPNSVYFQGINIVDKYGLVPGDLITTSGDVNAANNVTDKTISSIFVTPFGSYAVISGVTFVTSLGSAAIASFKSKYNVLPDGLGMTGEQVDVPEFIRINDTFSSSIFTYDFYVTEDIDAKDFIDTMILFPTGGFSLPRKGKISVGYSSPPLAISSIPVLDSSNTAKPEQTRITRSFNKLFYNNVVYRYNKDLLEDKFLNGNVNTDQDSKNRIPVGNRVMLIDAPGLRPSTSNDTIISILKDRILDRYKFGAESVQARVFYGKSFNIDVGDTVIFGDENLKLPDTKFGSRDYRPRIFEIQNKTMDIKSGDVQLNMVDTNFSAEGSRFGVISPASVVGSGSTTTQIVITDSFATTFPGVEADKWIDYIGEKVLVHNTSFSNSQEVTFTGFLSGNNYVMLVSPALSFTPGVGDIVEVINYPTSTDPSVSALYKNIFDFMCPSVAVTGGSSSTVFTVGAGDVSKLFVGAFVILHTDDATNGWTSVSVETTITSIVGTTITVADALGFTPTSSYFVELIGFSNDEGFPYRYI